MIDLRTELAPLLDTEHAPSLGRVKAGVTRRRRRRVILRSASALLVVAVAVGAWVARPTPSSSIKTANTVVPDRIKCQVSVGGTSVTAAFALVVREGATVHIEGSALTFTVVASPGDGVLWMLRVVATRSPSIPPFSARGGFIPGRPGFGGAQRTNDGGYLTYQCRG